MNAGHAFGYGHDGYTLGVEARVAEAFGDQAQAFFVFNGTGANVLCLRAACRPFEAVICADTAHLQRRRVRGARGDRGRQAADRRRRSTAS